MHVKSGMHKPRYTQRKRQSNIYMKEYIDELWRKISWGTRAWGWRVASFVEILCLLVHLGLTHPIEHGIFNILCGFRARCILPEFWSHVFVLGLWTRTNYSVFHRAIRQKAPTHGTLRIVGIWGLMFCFIAGGRLTVSDFPEYFVKSVEYRFDWSSASLKQGPIQMLAPDRQIQIENPIVR